MVIVELEQEWENWPDSKIRRAIEGLKQDQPDLINYKEKNDYAFDREFERRYRCKIIYRDEMKTALNAVIAWEDRDYFWFKIGCP